VVAGLNNTLPFTPKKLCIDVKGFDAEENRLKQKNILANNYCYVWMNTYYFLRRMKENSEKMTLTTTNALEEIATEKGSYN